jgi:hypothetical protein
MTGQEVIRGQPSMKQLVSEVANAIWLPNVRVPSSQGTVCNVTIS